MVVLVKHLCVFRFSSNTAPIFCRFWSFLAENRFYVSFV